MIKKFKTFSQIALMLFVFAMMLPQLKAQPIGSKIRVSADSTISYWNGSAWISVPSGQPGQSLQFVSGVPSWVNSPQGVTTNAATSITVTSAISGGSVQSNGGSVITACGVCWNTSPNPTLANNHTVDGTSIGNFTSNLYGLLYNNTYYIRAYASNSAGTTYGNEVSFIATDFLPAHDIDNNGYDTVRIGSQTWMKQNLKVTHYNNGDAIPNVIDNAAWDNLTTGAYCNYNNDVNNAATYGRLYNFYTVADARNLCPIGWHVPSIDEFTTLINCLGGENIAGSKLKEAGTLHWNSPNTGATNETSFTALPGGSRDYLGNYNRFGYYGMWWSSTSQFDIEAWYVAMSSTDAGAHNLMWDIPFAYSVRCLKNQ